MSIICSVYCYQYLNENTQNNKTDCHNITEILLKVALNTITPQCIKQKPCFSCEFAVKLVDIICQNVKALLLTLYCESVNHLCQVGVELLVIKCFITNCI